MGSPEVIADLVGAARQGHNDAQRESVVRLLAAASFLVFFQSYLLAPLIPSLAIQFHASARSVGLLVPAYMLPYGISTLFYGPVSDSLGRRPVLLTMLGALCLCIFATALAQTVQQLILWRIIAGVASGGIIPIGLALLADLFPYAQRGRPVGWIFGAIAGGMAFGSSAGALLNPLIGWRWEMGGLSFVGALIFVLALRNARLLQGQVAAHPVSLRIWLGNYVSLLRDRRGGRAYLFIWLNGMFHSGIFAWLGVYFSQRYNLSDAGIGLALLGYGVPGMLLGPTIGHLADRVGRNAIIPAGFLVAALMAAVLAPASSLLVGAMAVTVLSFGFDMSHPPLAGIITSIHPTRVGQAMGLNAFVLFTGFGLGALVFQGLLEHCGFAPALLVFAGVEVALGTAGFYLFRNERATTKPPG